jgi:hypothetical protein
MAVASCGPTTSAIGLLEAMGSVGRKRAKGVGEG